MYQHRCHDSSYSADGRIDRDPPTAVSRSVPPRDRDFGSGFCCDCATSAGHDPRGTDRGVPGSWTESVCEVVRGLRRHREVAHLSHW